MTNKERVINAIEGKRVDHVPMTFSIHFPKEVAFGDAAVKSHLDFYKNTEKKHYPLKRRPLNELEDEVDVDQ